MEITCVYLPDTVVQIAKYSFYNCKGLEEVYIGNGVLEIPESSFRGCESLPQVDLSHTQLTMIGQQAFTGCLALERISLPPTLLAGKMGMESNAFLGCESLASMEFPGRGFFDCVVCVGGGGQ